MTHRYEPLRLTFTTPPVELPIGLSEVKSELRIEEDQIGDHALLMAYVRTAVDAFESLTWRVLITQTWTLFRDAWPYKSTYGDQLWEGWRTGADVQVLGRDLDLPRPPLQSVVHVKTYDDSDVATIWAASNYFVDTASVPGRLVARVGQTFPVTTRTANGIEIQFKAGYGDTGNDVPQAIRDGLLQFVQALYDCGGDEGDAKACTPGKAAHALWYPYKILRF